MALIGTKLLIFKRDGTCSGAYETNENNLTIGGSIVNDIRIKIPEADPYICKINLDDFGRVSHDLLLFITIIFSGIMEFFLFI